MRTKMSVATSPEYNVLVSLLREVSSLHEAMGILGWDEHTMMPSGSAESRGRQKAALAGVAHEKATSEKLGKAIEKCEAVMDQLSDAYAKANVRDARKSYEERTKVPKNVMMEREEAETAGYAAWITARKNDDWASFAPVMKNGLRISKLYAQQTRPGMEPYDAAIDMYERGMTAARLQEVFNEIAPPLRDLLDKVTKAKKSAPPIHDILKGGDSWDVSAQAKLCRRIAEMLTFDFDKGRIDVSAHPFTGGAGPLDTRITTRYSAEKPFEGIMGTVHEVGHGLYEQGRNEKHFGLPVSEALSMGSHESQSLFWERMVAQGEPFWSSVLPLVHDELPFTKGLNGSDFAYAVNQVDKSGLIRVDADELSYPFHVIVRFEIERGLFDGSIDVDDLPSVWNAKMKKYFDVDVPDNARGCLQDVHWPSLAYGYFPSYTLGAMVAAQLYAYMDRKALPGMEKRISEGQFGEIKEFLNTKFHVLGSLHTSLDELLIAVTGEPLKSKYFIEYLTNKYTKIYNL